MATPNPLLHPISTLRLLIVFLSLLFISNAVDPQLTALLAVAKAIGHPRNLTQYWQGDDFCHNWEFITCTPERNVTIINFEKQHLSGTISPAFANLTSLTSLRLNDNNLTGSIPDVLATDLPRLVFLDVSNNNLSGKVPVFPSTVKFLVAGNDDLLLGCSDGSGSSTNSPTSEEEPNGFGSSTDSPTSEEASKMATFFMVSILVIFCYGTPLYLWVMRNTGCED